MKVDKYEIQNDNGILTVLRNGERWDRNLVGDSFVLALVQEIESLRSLETVKHLEEENAKLRAKIEGLVSLLHGKELEYNEKLDHAIMTTRAVGKIQESELRVEIEKLKAEQETELINAKNYMVKLSATIGEQEAKIAERDSLIARMQGALEKCVDFATKTGSEPDVLVIILNQIEKISKAAIEDAKREKR